MEVINAEIFKPDLIVVKTLKELQSLISLIYKEEDFIITWIEDKCKKSELIVCTHLIARVKNNELRLTSKEAS